MHVDKRPKKCASSFALAQVLGDDLISFLVSAYVLGISGCFSKGKVPSIP
ncbi:MAG: hypothetical protein ACTHKY_12655 [Ginsengibacter sp.]